MSLFIVVLLLTVVQRLIELWIAKRNTVRLLQQGAIEFGSKHYPVIVLLHSAFFLSLVVEYYFTPASFSAIFIVMFCLAQLGRVWVLRAMGSRWTTRIIARKGEELVMRGPFRFLRHPNYTVVAIELLSLPLAFGLEFTAVTFSLLNALVLLGIRIPAEEKALRWATGNSEEGLITS